MREQDPMRLWYDRPAETWLEALPLGNGTTGAMAFGGIGRARYQINDATAWSGSPDSELAPPRLSQDEALANLEAARERIAAGDFGGATPYLQALQHRHSQSFLPFVDLELGLRFPGAQEVLGRCGESVTDYTRGLTLGTAVHTVEYRVDRHAVMVESFASFPDGVLVIRVETDHPDGLAPEVRLTSQLRILELRESVGRASIDLQMPTDVAPIHDGHLNPVIYSGGPGRSLQGAAVVGWKVAGRAATICLATATTFSGLGMMPQGTAADARARAAKRVEGALTLGAESLRERHLADYRALFGRVSISTGDPRPELPSDERLLHASAAPGGALAADPGLAGLLFQYGRYLLISSSRDGGVPANLQGIWNDELQPPWSSNYTLNINLEMNYWPAEVTNLSECVGPLADLIEALAATGTRTARELYGAPGWVAHHNTDIWAYSRPVGHGRHDPQWAFWPMAGPWLLRHLWEHLLFGSGDAKFARERLWPLVRSSVQFYLFWLREDGAGALGTSPSTSPENQFIDASGAVVSAAESSTMDLTLIADLFRIASALEAELGEDDELIAAARAALSRIPGPPIGPDGMIAEWRTWFRHPNPQHRHVSHLYFAFPGAMSMDSERAGAVMRSLDGRGDESTGWSLAWKIALRARLAQPEKVGDLMRLVFRDMCTDRGPTSGGLYPNYLAAHPPFQIDGNFGFTAGLAECLLQSHAGAIEILKAVPAELPQGTVRGLVARPGLVVDIAWEPDGAGVPSLMSTTISVLRRHAAGRYDVLYRDVRRSIEVGEPGSTLSSVTLTRADFVRGS